MGSHLLRRLLLAPAVLVLLSIVSFLMIAATPGGPLAGERALDPSVRAELEHKYYLDRPMVERYALVMRDLVTGDLKSIKYKSETVNAVMARTLPTSLLLGLLALVAAVGIGVPAGIAAALRPRSPGDHLGMVGALVAISLPTFVVGPLLALVFGLWLGWLPIAGYAGWEHPSYLVLPALALAAPFAGRIARLTRTGLLEVLSQDFVRTARAKGLSESAIAVRHALRLGFVPVASFLGPATAYILTGSLVIEQVFQIPGMGREVVQAALSRDEWMVMGMVIVYGAILVGCNLLADLAVAALDPRSSRA
jgi:oligopeptide transport system permease protein